MFFNQIVYSLLLRFRAYGTLIVQGFEMAKMMLKIFHTYIIQIWFLLHSRSDCVIFGLFSKDVRREYDASTWHKQNFKVVSDYK